MTVSPGADLALLLLSGFESMVEEVTAELVRRGHADIRPTQEFALRAVAAGAETASELGRRQGVSKQAAAKTIAVLEGYGYVAREDDPADARRKRVVVTPRGEELMRVGSQLFDDVRARWAQRLGPGRLEAFEADLARVVTPMSIDDLAARSAD